MLDSTGKNARIASKSISERPVRFPHRPPAGNQSRARVHLKSGIIPVLGTSMNIDVLNRYRDQQLDHWTATLEAICTRVSELKAPDPNTGELREPTPEEKTMMIHRAWIESFPLTPGR
jgi:hypothetical protein